MNISNSKSNAKEHIDQPPLKERLKILFVSRDMFPPFRVDVSVLFGKEMVRKGHQVDWVLQSEADCKKFYHTIWSGNNCWIGPTNNGTKMIHRLHKHLLGFFHNIRCLKLIVQKRYDCIQLKDRFFSSVFYLLFAKIRKVTFFFWLSYPVPEAFLHRFQTRSTKYPLVYLIRGILYKFLLYKIIIKYSDHVFVQSEQMKKDIQAEGFDAQCMTAIPMGIDMEAFDLEGETKTASDIQKARIVYLGTLSKTRRMDFIIKVFAKVIKKIPDAKLYLIGKGDTEEDIENLVNEARKFSILESIIFTGFIDRPDALKLVNSAEVCLSPFYPTPVLNSTSPTKLIEYMAMGKPVVANDHPEQKFVIEKSGAGICVPYREADFAEAIIYLLKHPNICEKMGAVGKKWVLQHRTYPLIANKVECVYYNTINHVL